MFCSLAGADAPENSGKLQGNRDAREHGGYECTGKLGMLFLPLICFIVCSALCVLTKVLSKIVFRPQ